MDTPRCIVYNTVFRGSALWGEQGAALWTEMPGGRLLFDSGQSAEFLDQVVTGLRERCEGQGSAPYLTHYFGEKILAILSLGFGEPIHPSPAGK